jgi:protein SCO1/2
MMAMRDRLKPAPDKDVREQGREHGRHRHYVGRMPALAWLAVLAAFSGGVAVPHEVETPPPATKEPGLSAAPRLLRIKPAPDFALRDPKGQPVRLSALRGRILLVSFMYTTCASSCPLLTQRMAVLQDRLMSSEVWGRKVVFLSIGIDPERDTAEALNAYAERFGADAEGWRFLSDEPVRLRPVLTAYGEWTRPLPDGEIDHPARLYLIDRQGEIREVYALSFFDERQVFLDIKALLDEAP